MRILGLDLGSACGWCLLDTEAPSWTWGELGLSPGKHEGGGMRYLRFERHLEELLADVDMVVYESVRHVKFVGAAQVVFGLTAVLQRVCESIRMPYEGVTPSELKKHATGKGNSGKPAMREALERRLEPALRGSARAAGGFDPTENETDAIWLAHYAAKKIAPRRSATGSREDQITIIPEGAGAK
jgi:Holliday junction resolvasome RuvABC endonuclease subunit